MGEKLTVVLTCWRRFDNLERIVRAWLAEPDVGEVILWDNSPGDVVGGNDWSGPATALFAAARRLDQGGDHAVSSVYAVGLREALSDPRLWVIRSSRNCGSSARYALAALAKHELLMFGDDDILPKPGLIADLMASYTPERMVGVKGRIFHGSYHRNTEVRGELLKPGSDPVEVDMLIGHIMLTHRSWLLGYNFADAAWTCCELQLQGRIFKDMRDVGQEGAFSLWVVPSDKHEELPEATDDYSLYRHASATAEKERVWAELFKGHCLEDGVA